MMENGFSSPRSDSFPAGLRVLVVDDDPTWLKILEKMLKKCSYEVTTCGLARDALNLLRETKDGYDIVISDVNMPDMDGFKLLEHVGLEMDLPVIMMSVDGETSRVMKGVQHGACDYLLKPIRMKELRNIWQHVFRKKIHEVRDIESYEGTECLQLMRHGSDLSDDDLLLSVDDLTSSRKRKDVDNKYDDKDFGDLSSSAKKARVVWTVDLHQKFVKAVNHIGFDKVGPKKIRDLMNVPWLTRENVASHLQKYRLYLSRLQKDNDCKPPFNGTKLSELASKDPAGNFCHQNSFNTHQNDAANGNYVFPGNKVLLQNADPKIHVGEPKGSVSVPTTETNITFTGDVPETQRGRNSIIGFNHHFVSHETDMKYAAFNSPVPAKYSWSEVPEIQSKKECKSLAQFEDGFSHLPLPASTQNQNHGDQLHPAPSYSSGASVAERNTTSQVETKSLYEFKSNHHSSSSGSTIDSFPVQTKSHLVNQEVIEPISTTTESSLKNQVFNQNQISGSGVTVSHVDEELPVFWLQGDSHNMNIGFQNFQFPDYNDPGLITEIPFHLYDALRSDYEFPCDPPEYSLLEQGLFIA